MYWNSRNKAQSSSRVHRGTRCQPQAARCREPGHSHDCTDDDGTAADANAVRTRGAAPAECCTIAPVTEALPTVLCRYLLLDPFVCTHVTVHHGVTEFFWINDCQAGGQCFTDGHTALVVIAILFAAVYYATLAVPERPPIGRHTWLWLGVPHLMPAVATFRLLATYAAKILYFLSPCGALSLAVIANAFIAACTAYALDSRRLSKVLPLAVVLVLVELWIAALSIVSLVVFIDANGYDSCAVVAACVLGLVYLWILIMLYVPTTWPDSGALLTQLAPESRPCAAVVSGVSEGRVGRGLASTSVFCGIAGMQCMQLTHSVCPCRHAHLQHARTGACEPDTPTSSPLR